MFVLRSSATPGAALALLTALGCISMRQPDVDWLNYEVATEQLPPDQQKDIEFAQSVLSDAGLSGLMVYGYERRRGHRKLWFRAAGKDPLVVKINKAGRYKAYCEGILVSKGQGGPTRPE